LSAFVSEGVASVHFVTGATSARATTIFGGAMLPEICGTQMSHRRFGEISPCQKFVRGYRDGR
jgi:hypothetical protein